MTVDTPEDTTTPNYLGTTYYDICIVRQWTTERLNVTGVVVWTLQSTKP